MQLPAQQKRTFLPYERGIPPEDLRLGSLYINPLEPTDGLDSERFEYREDIERQTEYDAHIKQWTRKEEIDVPFSIQFESSQASSVGLSFSEWLGVKGERDKAKLATLQGASGRRVKIRKPEVFLGEVMKQEGVERWIRKHASIAHKSTNGKHKWKAPELWVVTGIQYVTGGEFHFQGSASSKMGASAGGDLGAALGAASGAFRTKAEASRERSEGAQYDFGHSEERVWAAQFMPVKIEFGLQPEDPQLRNGNERHPKAIIQIQLDDIQDLTPRGFRAGQEEGQGSGTTTTELIGRIVADPPVISEDDGGSDEEGLVIDDTPYVTSMQNANWDMYKEYCKWLKTAKRGPTQHISSNGA